MNNLDKLRGDIDKSGLMQEAGGKANKNNIQINKKTKVGKDQSAHGGPGLKDIVGGGAPKDFTLTVEFVDSR
jgi:hypothetical protein